MLARIKGVTAVLALALLPALTMDGPAEAQRASTPVYVQHGVASWYGPGFHGRRTASGERFNQNRLTAAHKKLPLGTRVTVVNLRNGKSVEVEINDRGPHVRGRILDLSRAAAEQLGMKKTGVAPVRIEVDENNWQLADRANAS